MLSSPYSVRQLKIARELSRFVREDKKARTQKRIWYVVPSRDYSKTYDVIMRLDRGFHNAFVCPCVFGRMRTESTYPIKWCVHVLAVILYRIRKGLTPHKYLEFLHGNELKKMEALGL